MIRPERRKRQKRSALTGVSGIPRLKSQMEPRDISLRGNQCTWLGNPKLIICFLSEGSQFLASAGRKNNDLFNNYQACLNRKIATGNCANLEDRLCFEFLDMEHFRDEKICMKVKHFANKNKQQNFPAVLEQCCVTSVVICDIIVKSCTSLD